MKDWVLKVFSVLMGIFAWVYVNSEANITVRTILVPIDYKNNASDKVIVSELSKQVEVTIRGPSHFVSRVEASPPTLKIEIPSDVGRNLTVPISRESLDIADPVQVVEMRPDEIEVNFDSRITREVPIEVIVLNPEAEEVRIEKIESTPSKIAVTGAASIVGKLKVVRTEPLDLRDVLPEPGERSITQKVRIAQPGNFIELPLGSEVQVDVAYSGVTATRRFGGISVAFEGDESYAVAPKSVNIEVSGLRKVLDKLSPSSVVVFVEGNGAKLGENLEPKVKVPDGVKVLSLEPPAVKLVRKGERREEKKVEKRENGSSSGSGKDKDSSKR